MRIDLTCPVELWQFELPSEGYPACSLMLYNLSDRLVSSVEVTAVLKDQAEEEVERVVFRGHDLDGRPGTAFRMVVPVNEKTRAASLEVTTEKVWFDDSSVWRRGRGPMTEYTPNALPNGRSLDMLRFVAGKNAVGYPNEQEGLWVCVCGRPNADYARTCARCRRTRDQVFTQYNREAIEKLVTQRQMQLDMKAKSAREDASRMQLEREAAYNIRRKRRRRIQATIATVVVVCAAAYGTVFHLLPYLAYRNAVTAMEASQWDTAITAFTDMADYRDAPELLKHCRYQAALEQLAAGDEASLVAARDAFLSLAGYEQAEEKAQEAEYQRAELFLNGGDTASASALYTLLDGYRDSDDKLKECAYIDACRLMASKSWQEALDGFRALGEYKDSALQVEDAVYQLALAAVEGGDPDAAMALLAEIPEYNDAPDLLQRAHYVKGAALKASGDNEAAGAEFLAAGDYEDAAEQVIACIYDPAEALLAEERYAEAMELYAQILGHRDATEKYMLCRYSLAETAVRDKEYGVAVELLATLPDDYQQVASLKRDCIYLPASDALDTGNWQEAVDGLTQVKGHRNADSLLQKAQYGLADQLTKEDRLDEAIALYEELGRYSQSVRKLRTARYDRAAQLMEDEDYAGAAALYEKLGSYSDSASLYKKAVFSQADQAYDAKNYAEARALYDQLGKYQGSDTRRMACDYQLAIILAESGELLEAAELFESVSEYEDAGYQAQVLYYELAQQAVASNQTVLAGRYYAKAGDYADARIQADENYDAYYLEAYVTAQDAIDGGDYMLAATLLGNMDLNNLPEKYKELADMYKEAWYMEGVRLYEDGKPYEARACFDRVPGYRAVENYLDNNCYRILGDWLTDGKTHMAFRDDGTCTINGEEKRFHVSGVYSVLIGETEETLVQAFNIVSMNDDSMTLRDEREESKAVYRFIRATEEEVKEALATPTPTAPPTATPTATPTDTPSTAPTNTNAQPDGTPDKPTEKPTAAPTDTPAPPTGVPGVTKNPDSFLVEDE